MSQKRKCLHLYFYYMDREFGLMHMRLATWLAFGIQVCLNGREYLARRMKKAGVGFEQRDNCFVRIDDLAGAQQMMHDLEKRKWERLLNTLARRVNPICFKGETSASYLVRAEGLRVKHRAEGNSIKMYDKQGSVLRIETTINNVRCFKVRRMTARKGVRGMRWIPMRFGLADLDRRVDVSRAANERYLEALAIVDVPSPTHQLLDPVSRSVTKDQKALSCAASGEPGRSGCIPSRAIRRIHDPGLHQPQPA